MIFFAKNKTFVYRIISITFVMLKKTKIGISKDNILRGFNFAMFLRYLVLKVNFKTLKINLQ